MGKVYCGKFFRLIDAEIKKMITFVYGKLTANFSIIP